ncbi:hypothetical protein [Methylobacterium iners]|uniref:hypothetical protein n=1 Tax=Methylobacterium iners TaxID=418707 RepID=UPI001EE188C1
MPTRSPIHYEPTLETVQADEDQVHAGMVEQFAKIQTITLKDYGHAVRGVHAKGHGLLTGSLEVLPGLPPHLAQGLAATPGTHEVVLRFSTNPGDILDDSVSTPRGLAVKVLGVEGERLPGAGGQDPGLRDGQRPGLHRPGCQVLPRDDEEGSRPRATTFVTDWMTPSTATPF